MTGATNAGTSASRLAALHLRRDQDADFTLSCQGTNIPAHSFLLASTSEYFERALSRDWLEKKEKKMDLKDCSVEALHVAVNFMYGINIPEDFKEHAELLHLAELFMMDNLKEVVEERLAQALTKANYLEVSQIAELYSITSLITKCGHFLFEEIGDGDEISWEEIVKLPKVMTAFGKRAKRGKEDVVPLKVLKKRDDFESDELYGKYVKQNVEEGSVVRMRERVVGFFAQVNVGDIVTVDSKGEESDKYLTVITARGKELTLFSHRVEIL